MNETPRRERLDKLIIERGWAKSRPRAERLISEFGILVDGEQVKKPGKRVAVTAELKPLGEEMPWVSRGALKLLAALDAWPELNPLGRIVLDVGSSTGGFTQVCLDRGAIGVCAVDTGTEQLAEELRNDSRIDLHEQTNVLDLQPETLTSRFNALADVAVVDVSFVSVNLLLPALPKLLRGDAQVLVLVKPQFEVGPTGLGRNGIVRNARLRSQAVDRVRLKAMELGAEVAGEMESPVVGGDGNVEYLLWLRFTSLKSH